MFTRTQLRAAGITDRRERRALATGRWIAVVPEAYVIAGRPIGPWQRAFAAVAVSGGALSHQSAATAQGIEWPTVATHVTIQPHGNVILPGVRVHHHLLRPDETCHRDGVWMTNTRRTAIDCLATLPWREASDFAREAVFRGWVDHESLAMAIHERFGWRGTPQLVRVQRMLGDGGRSEGERVFHRVLRAAGIAGWRANVVLRDEDGVIGEFDVVFEAELVLAEVDGYAIHSRRETFQRDHTKQNRAAAAGYVVLRFTWDDLVQRPHQVVAKLRGVLDQRRPRERAQ